MTKKQWCRVCGLCDPDLAHRMRCPNNPGSKAFTEAAPLAKGLAAPAAVDVPEPRRGAFTELPCIACHGMHAPGQGCGH